MQKIMPCLWFDNQSEEAARFYTSLFADSKRTGTALYGEAGPGPKGSVMTVTFQLQGRSFMALNGGTEFDFTPATSFFVSCATEEEIDALWRELSKGGTVAMELAKYPFSRKFGWTSDRFGVSWQLNLVDQGKGINPFLMFVGKQHGKAEEAMKSYVSLFKDSRIEQVERYGADRPGETEGTVVHGRFTLAGQAFMAMDSARDHKFSFTPAISFAVDCKTQEEVDELWEKLSDGGAKGQCGWLEDRFGVSWQIVPTVLPEMMQDKDAQRVKRVMNAMFKMTRLDIKTLRSAWEG
jgi:predicted 3-demethylubiquinone-9 3-methyltransferase (glyoxalase superfamily)